MHFFNKFVPNIFTSEMKSVVALVCLLSSSLITYGQLRFTDKTKQYAIDHIYGMGQAGGGVSFSDFNGDGLDDLTLASSIDQPISFFENTGSQLIKRNFLPELKREIKHILWVDYDNDGDQDIYVTMAESYNRLFRNDNFVFNDVTDAMGLPLDEYTSFGATWADFNRDGYLDLYYGVRRIEANGMPNNNRLFFNKITHFEDQTFIGDAEDSGKTPFCSGALDYDKDGWPDIYTAHDRKRGNTMLHNDKGIFKNVSIQTNTGLKMDGMSVSIGDFNNDSWQDIYVSNSEAGNALFVNKKGETFQNIAEFIGIAYKSVAWGTNFLDGDNDGDRDLYISGMLAGANQINSEYFENQFPANGFNKGTKIPSDTLSSFNNAIGDINNDGYPDIAVINVANAPSLIFQNVGGERKYIKVKLQGVMSNRDGIGSEIITYAKGIATQYLYTHTGIGFMGQNSKTYIIGIRNNIVCDSIKVKWSSGHIDIIKNIAANTTLNVVEGMSTQGIIHVDSDFKRLTTSVKEFANSTCKVIPNPSTGDKIRLQTKSNDCIQHLSSIDINGNQSTLIMDADGSIDIGHLPSGMFILLVQTCDKSTMYTTWVKI